MPTLLDAVADLSLQIENIASDPELDATDRALKLKVLRDRIVTVLGSLDRHLSNVEKLRESQASEHLIKVLQARQNADLREALIESGERTADELDEEGLLSHAELDRLAEEGLLTEAVEGVDKWDPLKHPRARGGLFRNVYGELSRYFHLDHPKTEIVPMSSLTRHHNSSEEKVQKAKTLMDASHAGRGALRQPLAVRKEADGKYTVIDGNSTHANLEKMGISHAPVQVIGNEEIDQKLREHLGGYIHDRAAAAERDISPILEQSVSSFGGSLSGFEHRLKTKASIAGKIKRNQGKYPGMSMDQAANRISDALRYTALLPSSRYTSGTSDILQHLEAAGYKVYDSENYWGKGDDYDGYHVGLLAPNGATVELQFHTPQSFKVKQSKNHPLYEEFRDESSPERRWQLWQEMVAHALQIKSPKGIENLPGSKMKTTDIPESEQAHSLGATPFRAAKDTSDNFLASDRAKEFEAYLPEAAKKYGVDVVISTPTVGMWSDGSEPSWDIKVKDGEEGVRKMAEDLRAKFDQEAVVSFHVDLKGKDWRFQVPEAGSHPERAQEAMRKFGIENSRILPDGTLEVMTTERDRDQTLKALEGLRKELGAQPLRAAPGHFGIFFGETE